MTSEDVILERIEHLSETVRQQWCGIKTQSADIGEIKKTVETIAVQSNRIDNLSGQINELWIVRKEHDSRLIVAEKFQASCPRDQNEKDKKALERRVNDTMQRQWVIISLLFMCILGIYWKLP